MGDRIVDTPRSKVDVVYKLRVKVLDGRSLPRECVGAPPTRVNCSSPSHFERTGSRKRGAESESESESELPNRIGRRVNS